MWWKAKNRLLRERRRLRTGQVTSWWSTPPWQKDFTKSTDTTGSVSVYQWASNSLLSFYPDKRSGVAGKLCFPSQWRCVVHFEQEKDLPLGLSPANSLRDPRIRRLWSKSSKTELSVAKFKVSWCLSSTDELSRVLARRKRIYFTRKLWQLLCCVLTIVFQCLYNQMFFC